MARAPLPTSVRLIVATKRVEEKLRSLGADIMPAWKIDKKGTYPPLAQAGCSTHRRASRAALAKGLKIRGKWAARREITAEAQHSSHGDTKTPTDPFVSRWLCVRIPNGLTRDARVFKGALASLAPLALFSVQHDST